MPYLFGDTERATRRLEALARVFRPASVSFLAAWRVEHGLDPAVEEPIVIDLGCGPGFTTRLLAGEIGAPVLGLDTSEPFLWEARRLGPSRVAFAHADITQAPFPAPPAHLLFARFLLTHLADLPAAFVTWERVLRPGGWILIEDVEAIDTDLVAFRRYLDLVAGALTAQAKELYVGPRIVEAVAGTALAARVDRVHRLAVTAADAATMFSLNLPSLRESAHVREALDEAALDALQAELDEISATLPSPVAIEWGVRQIALELE